MGSEMCIRDREAGESVRPVARIPELPDGLPGSCRSRAVSSLDPVDRLQACDKIGTILNRLSESDKLSAFSD